jgi:hypothetical protein
MLHNQTLQIKHRKELAEIERLQVAPPTQPSEFQVQAPAATAKGRMGQMETQYAILITVTITPGLEIPTHTTGSVVNDKVQENSHRRKEPERTFIDFQPGLAIIKRLSWLPGQR